MQALVINSTFSCMQGSQSLVSGGCPISLINDTYRSPRYTTSSGSSANFQFKLSALASNSSYYLVIDGTGGNISKLYIEVNGGTLSCNAFLPIQLTNFDYSCNNETLKLNWSTASESNNDYFLVFGSADGMEWIEVGKIAGANNSINKLNYNFNIPKHYSNLNYYKLKQVDFDNSYSYSNILYVDCQSKNKIEIFPNPFADELNIKVHLNELVPYQISTVLNQVVNSGYVNSESSTIKLSELPSGIYFIKVDNSNSYKIIKQ